MTTRRVIIASAIASLTLGRMEMAAAQSWPARPVHVFVGFPPGDPNDIVARLMGQWLSDRLRQPFIIENRPGAGGNLAMEAAVRAAPDGHTLILMGPAAAINATLYKDLKFSVLRDVAPIGNIVRLPQTLVVTPSMPARTLREFIDYAKANPGTINYASPGIGTGPHVAAELFKMMAGVDVAHVPYRGMPQALTDLLSGQVQALFTGSAGEHIRAGRLRGLAVTAAKRIEAQPEIPAIAETLPGFESSSWFGLGAPRETPSAIIEKLSVEIQAALANPDIRKRLVDMGGIPAPGTPGEFKKLLVDETEKWAGVVRFSGAKVE